MTVIPSRGVGGDDDTVPPPPRDGGLQWRSLIVVIVVIVIVVIVKVVVLGIPSQCLPDGWVNMDDNKDNDNDISNDAGSADT